MKGEGVSARGRMVAEAPGAIRGRGYSCAKEREKEEERKRKDEAALGE